MKVSGKKANAQAQQTQAQVQVPTNPKAKQTKAPKPPKTYADPDGAAIKETVADMQVKAPLHERAMLVKLSMSVWTAAKTDKEVSEEIAYNKGAVANAKKVGRFSKKLVADNQWYTDIISQRQAINNWFKENTVPWGNGFSVVPLAKLAELQTTFDRHEAEFNRLVDNFVRSYADPIHGVKAAAQRNLGQLYKDEDYPHENEILGKFGIGLDIMPIPPNDIRIGGIDSDTLAKIKARVSKATEASIKQANQEMWARLTTEITKVAEALEDTTKRRRFADLFKAAGKAMDQLSTLNISEDERFDDVVKIAKQLFSETLDSATIRASDKVKEQAKQTTRALAEKAQALAAYV